MNMDPTTNEPMTTDAKSTRGPVAREASAERGMSVIEVLIAAGLLMVISLGILALLTRSMANTNRGWEATSASNMVRGQLDSLVGQPFDIGSMLIASGQTENETDRFWATGSPALDNDDDEGWYDTEADALGRVMMERNVIIRQYNVKTLFGEPTNFNDVGEFEFTLAPSRLDSGLSGDINPTYVHIKRVEVTYKGVREGGALGAGQRLKAETFKSF